MQLIPFKLSTLDTIINSLKKGEVIAHPADTCFGFAADPLNPGTIQKIQAIKGREKLKPMSLMLPLNQLDKLSDWGEMSDFAWKVARRLFPGPVTLVLPKGPKVPEGYFPETDLIGLRIPDHKPTQFILEAFGGPLITTSANPSGQPIAFDHQTVLNDFKNQKDQPALIVEGQLTTHNSASTVLQVHEDSLEILREGPIKKESLEGMGFDCQ